MQARWLIGFTLGLAACSGRSVIGSGEIAVQGSGASAGLATAAGTGGAAGGPLLTGGSADGGGVTGSPAITIATGGEPSDEAGTAPGSKCSTALVASDDRNYSVTGSRLSLATVHVKPNAELTIDWSRVKHGLAGPVDAKTGIDAVDLTFVSLPAAEVIDRLNADTLYQQFWRWVLTLPTNEALTSASTLDLDRGTLTSDALLAQFDPKKYPPSENSYLVELTNSGAVGVGVQAAALFTLDDASSTTEVRLSDTSATFEYTSALPSSAVRAVPVGTPNISLDFSGLTVDALGRPFNPNVLSVRVVMTSTELTAENESTLLDLPVSHEWHAVPQSFGKIDLSTLTDDEGNPFNGIDGTNTWFLELWSDSILPAPAYLILLSPCVNPR